MAFHQIRSATPGHASPLMDPPSLMDPLSLMDPPSTVVPLIVSCISFVCFVLVRENLTAVYSFLFCNLYVWSVCVCFKGD